MKKAVFEYKCRRCGAIEKEYQISLPNGETEAQLLLFKVLQGSMKPKQPPLLCDLHFCSKFVRGASDLLGYQIEEE
jgi:hypothetical protein